MIYPLVIYNREKLNELIKFRDGETKFGERVISLNNTTTWKEELSRNKSKYVLVGLPEDIGVRANFGRGGAYSAWHPTLVTLLNTQSNLFLDGEELLVLGHLDFSSVMLQFKDADFNDEIVLSNARSIVAEIDLAVKDLIKEIVKNGKEPIVVGGGHNNAYGCIRGTSEALGSSINAINCDAHSDFRKLEGRHSGNGFSYAHHENYLDKYSIIALQESFNTRSTLLEIEKESSINYTSFEDMFIEEKISFKEAIYNAIESINDKKVGIELDLDTVQNIPSSAKTSSGISTIQARQYVSIVASNCDVAYLHLAEAAPILSHIKTDLKTGKLLAYLITDYIKARNKKLIENETNR
jgi:formiminoglutamase